MDNKYNYLNVLLRDTLLVLSVTPPVVAVQNANDTDWVCCEDMKDLEDDSCQKPVSVITTATAIAQQLYYTWLKETLLHGSS